MRQVSRQWCHLVAEGNDLESLHAFASRIGCRRSWFQDRPGFPHYDLTPGHRAVAVREGAVDIKLRDLIRMMRVDERDGQ